MSNLDKKICILCGLPKPRTLEFFKSRKCSKDGFRSECRKCTNKREKSYYFRYTERVASVRRSRVYNLDPDRYSEIFIKQNGVCAICLGPETRVRNGKVLPLGVDHDHKSGIVRGLLCHKCNAGLGMFNDDLNLISNAMNYMENNIGLSK